MGGETPTTYQEAICNLASVGLTRHRIARQLSMAPATLASWLERGEADFETDARTDFCDFYLQFEASRADFVTRQLQRIDKAGDEDWRAAVAALKIIHRDEFGDHSTVKHEGSIGLVEQHVDELTPVLTNFIEMLDLTPDQMQKVPDALERAFRPIERHK